MRPMEESSNLPSQDRSYHNRYDDRSNNELEGRTGRQNLRNYPEPSDFHNAHPRSDSRNRSRDDIRPSESHLHGPSGNWSHGQSAERFQSDSNRNTQNFDPRPNDHRFDPDVGNSRQYDNRNFNDRPSKRYPDRGPTDQPSNPNNTFDIEQRATRTSDSRFYGRDQEYGKSDVQSSHGNRNVSDLNSERSVSRQEFNSYNDRQPIGKFDRYTEDSHYKQNKHQTNTENTVHRPPWDQPPNMQNQSLQDFDNRKPNFNSRDSRDNYFRNDSFRNRDTTSKAGMVDSDFRNNSFGKEERPLIKPSPSAGLLPTPSENLPIPPTINPSQIHPSSNMNTGGIPNKHFMDNVPPSSFNGLQLNTPHNIPRHLAPNNSIRPQYDNRVFPGCPPEPPNWDKNLNIAPQAPLINSSQQPASVVPVTDPCASITNLPTHVAYKQLRGLFATHNIFAEDIVVSSRLYYLHWPLK